MAMNRLLAWLRPRPEAAPARARPQGPAAGFVSRTWVSADGLVLHARDYAPAAGHARLPVICIPGLTRNAADFEEIAPWIASRGRRVLAVDLRGRGGSAWDPKPLNYIPPTYAADVLGLMDAAGIARAVFVGTSLGGIVTMVVSTLRPSAIAAAVLNDVGPSLNPEALRRIGGYAGRDPDVTDWDGAVSYAQAVNGHAFPNYGPEQWRAFARRLFADGPDGRPRLAYDPEIGAQMRAAGPNPAAPDMSPLFLSLAAGRPLLLIRGGLSDLIDPPRVAAMRAMAPHMTYAEVPDVGHAPMLDEPEARDAIEALLESAP